MKKLLVLCLILAGCGSETAVVEGVPGKDGINGQDGAAGQNGSNGSAGQDGAQGSKGDKGDKGDKGNTGSAGAPGANGTNGTNGVGCTIASVSPGLVAPYGGAIVTCSNGSVLLVNGAPGANGAAAPVSPYQIDLVIDPCGDKPGITDEVLIKLHNGTLLASVSDNVNGYNTRLSSLAPNTSWITTDGSFCYVNVDANLNVTSHY